MIISILTPSAFIPIYPKTPQTIPSAPLQNASQLSEGHFSFKVDTELILPDGRFREYAFNRDIAALVASKLTSLGLNAEIIVPELTDVPLKERVSRINARCAALGTGNAICISIHANAAGNGSKWMNARGWSCYTSKGDTAADALATCLCEAAAKYFKDLRFLESEEGKELVTKVIAEGIKDYLSTPPRNNTNNQCPS